MEDEKKITILSVVLLVSVMLNLSLFYAMGSLGNQYEDYYIQEIEEWCEIVNQGNELVNILMSDLRSYDEGYKFILDVKMIECGFS